MCWFCCSWIKVMDLKKSANNPLDRDKELKIKDNKITFSFNRQTFKKTYTLF